MMMCLTQIQQRFTRIGFELIIETALGMQNMREIASVSNRVESLHFGVADYAASIQARTMSISGRDTFADAAGRGRSRRRLRGWRAGVTRPPHTCGERRNVLE
jgi:citrate lyase beta subunit